MSSKNIIPTYFNNLSTLQISQFDQLLDLYSDWNSKINVISRKDIDELYVRHVLHSLGIAKVIVFKPGTTILDVGTGGGFPGIPLAIMFPDCKFHLVDSIGKKIKVVNEVASALKLNNVFAEQARVEQVTGKFDFIVSRAVTRLKPFYQWIKNSVKTDSLNTLENGILYLKGGDLTEELREAKKTHTLYNLSEYFNEDFFETKKVLHVPIS